jgi:DNA replication protein DnaC
MGVQIAHFPGVKTLDDFDFKFQPSIDHKLVRELVGEVNVCSPAHAMSPEIRSRVV